MVRLVLFVTALLVGTAAYAQGDASQQHLKHKKKPAPTSTQQTADPNDVTTMPRDVQNWFSGAVGDILSGVPGDADPGKR